MLPPHICSCLWHTSLMFLPTPQILNSYKTTKWLAQEKAEGTCENLFEHLILYSSHCPCSLTQLFSSQSLALFLRQGRMQGNLTEATQERKRQGVVRTVMALQSSLLPSVSLFWMQMYKSNPLHPKKIQELCDLLLHDTKIAKDSFEIVHLLLVCSSRV